MSNDTTLPNFAYENDPDMQQAAAVKVNPAPGRYYLKFASVIPPVTVKTNAGGTNVEVLLPLTRLVGDEAGNALPSNTFDLISKFYTPSTFKKGNPKRSDLIDLLTLMSGGTVDIATLTTPAEWDVAIKEHIAGQITPKAVRMTYNGQVSWLDSTTGKKKYVHPVSGKPRYAKATDFYVDQDTYARVAYLVDGQFTVNPPFPADVTDNKAKELYANANGWGIAFSNFVPDFNAFAPEGK